MAKRLFVDVDDTLVIYENANDINPYGYYYDEPWRPNERLIGGIKSYRQQHPDALIVVWSGGGQVYAHDWVERLGLTDYNITALSKDPDFPRSGDIVIDDQPLNGIRTHTPFEWPSYS